MSSTQLSNSATPSNDLGPRSDLLAGFAGCSHHWRSFWIWYLIESLTISSSVIILLVMSEIPSLPSWGYCSAQNMLPGRAGWTYRRAWAISKVAWMLFLVFHSPLSGRTIKTWRWGKVTSTIALPTTRSWSLHSPTSLFAIQSISHAIHRFISTLAYWLSLLNSDAALYYHIVYHNVLKLYERTLRIVKWSESLLPMKRLDMLELAIWQYYAATQL